MLFPLPGIKNASSGDGGSHFQIPCVSTPQCFNVTTYPETRWGLTHHLSPVPILSKKLLARHTNLGTRGGLDPPTGECPSPPPIPLSPPAQDKDNVPEYSKVATGGISGRS